MFLLRSFLKTAFDKAPEFWTALGLGFSIYKELKNYKVGNYLIAVPNFIAFC